MSLLSAYKEAWAKLMLNWKTILLIWFINILLAFLLVSPLKTWLSNIFGNSMLQDGLYGPFDYTLFSEILRQNDVGLSMFISQLLLFIIPYYLWSIFYAGGFMGLLSRDDPDGFWKAGARYFSRFLRLSIYLIIGLVIFLGMMFAVLGVTSINLFEIENELILIRKFWIFLVAVGVFGFFFGLFRDLGKIEIHEHQSIKLITQQLLTAFKKSFHFKNILMALVNLLFLFLAVLLYFALSKCIGTHWITALLLSQLLIVLRIAYRFTRVSSLYDIGDREVDKSSSDLDLS